MIRSAEKFFNDIYWDASGSSLFFPSRKVNGIFLDNTFIGEIIEKNLQIFSTDVESSWGNLPREELNDAFFKLFLIDERIGMPLEKK